MQKILIIEHDEAVRESVGAMLVHDQFVPIFASDGKTGYEKILFHRPQLVILDSHLPGMSGLDICRTLRTDSVQTPIIVLSEDGDELEKVLLLETGADDYVVKPVGARELLARVRAVLRRSEPDASKILRFSDVDIDIERRIVSRAGMNVKLSPLEYKLLLFFVQNADRVLDRDLILNSVWGYDAFPNTRTVDAHVVKLRQKFEPDPSIPRHFLTVHRIGYRFIL